MKKTVLLFGTKFDLVARLQAYGLSVVLVDEIENYEADVSLVVDGPKSAVGNYDVEQFAEYKGMIDGVIVCLEDYVELAAATRERFFKELPGLTIAQAQLVRDKLRLKQFLLENGIPVARFSELADFSVLAEKLGTPFIVKPRLGFLAQGIEIISTQEDYSRWELAPRLELGGFYAEEYIQNPREFCCDTIVAGSRVIAQFPGEYTVNCLESNKTHDGFGVNFPGFLADNQLEEIKAYTRKFVEKLGVSDGFFHTEYLWDGKSWYFGESGCRLPGGLQIPVESVVSGVDILDLYIKMFVPHLRPKEILPVTKLSKPFAGYYLYPKKVGIVEEIVNHIPGTSGILESSVRINVGDTVKYEDSSVSMVASVIYEAKNQDDLKQWIDKAPTLFTVKYRSV